jgi:RNA polymerase sigma-70 factor, ECF subfamily
MQPAEDTLVHLARAGETPAFVDLMRRYNQRVFRIARAILPDDAEAEDAAQEAWVSAWRHLHQYEGRAQFSSWIARIVAREALGRARRRRAVSVGDEVEAMMDRSSDPERGAYDRETRVILEQAIDGLPDTFRAVFVLRAIEELSVAETAACLELNEDTVKTRLHRARQLLRTAIAGQFAGATGEVFAFAGERCDRIVAGVLGRLKSEAVSGQGSAISQ